MKTKTNKAKAAMRWETPRGAQGQIVARGYAIAGRYAYLREEDQSYPVDHPDRVTYYRRGKVGYVRTRAGQMLNGNVPESYHFANSVRWMLCGDPEADQ